MHPEDLSDRLAHVREKMETAAERSGRDASAIELVVVSKKHPVEKIREALEAGATVFGESRLQESLEKIPLLPARARWHFIGHVQKNKVRKLLPLFELFHGLDSLELAQDIDRIATELGLFPRVLLEVNVAGESTKHGFAPDALEPLMERLLSLPRLQIEGFMTMAPLTKDPEETRPFFSALRLLRDRLAVQTGIPLSTLSMGMSHDYQVAIEEGATLVRVGSAIFGKRE
jgi:pyridoxal phosphate enzyme (YggS family)